MIDFSFIQSDNTRKAINALREASEDRRAIGAIWTGTSPLSPDVKGCACLWMARALDIPVRRNMSTAELVGRISKASGIPVQVMRMVPSLNDAVKNPSDGLEEPRHTLAEIADILDIATWAFQRRAAG